MYITQKTYVTFELPKDFEALCEFEKKNDLRDAKKYEDTMFVTYEFVQNWFTEEADMKGEEDANF